MTDAKAFNNAFLAAHKGLQHIPALTYLLDSFAHILSAAEMMVLLDPTATAAAAALVATPSGDLQVPTLSPRPHPYPIACVPRSIAGSR